MTALLTDPRTLRQSARRDGADRRRQRLGVRPPQRRRDGRRGPRQMVRLRAVFLLVAEISAMHFTCAFDLKVPEKRRGALYELLALANERLWIGHFGMDSDDGMPVFRHSVLLRGAPRRVVGEPGGHDGHRDHRVRAVLPGVPVRAVGGQVAGRGDAGGDAGVRRRGMSTGPSRSLVGRRQMGGAMLPAGGHAPAPACSASIRRRKRRRQRPDLTWWRTLAVLPGGFAPAAVVLAVKPQRAAEGCRPMPVSPGLRCPCRSWRGGRLAASGLLAPRRRSSAPCRILRQRCARA